MSLKGYLMGLLSRVAIVKPCRTMVEKLTIVIGHKYPTNRIIISFCRHFGSQLIALEGNRFERVVTFASGGKMHCGGPPHLSRFSIMYYFLGTITGQTEDERPIAKLLSRAIRQGDVFLDIGANFGFYSFFVAPLCGASGEVHAFEPNPVLVQHLLRSVELNKLRENITINPVAVSKESNQSLQLYDPDRIGCSSLYPHEWLNAETSVLVPVITIDQYRREKNLTHIDVMKIDIEGAELDALRGMLETFQTSPPALIVCELMPLYNTYGEFNLQDLHRAPSAPEPTDIVDFLYTKGYQPWNIRPYDGRLCNVVHRDAIKDISRKVSNVAFIRADLKQVRPELFATNSIG